ncbi:ABC transporter ATP-binding protein [Lutibacter sp.]|uniref:ABC transporter ATP-binding protein n=1 Tax=Lutibacter sp. TaxID=1925666 RepID=UPI0025C233BE|nr:ABC transporter ATP-binding protein [Lutibacter sp.]MCF6182624.1 ABC transporter ATP-binding protein [Lutibacter sp.]
MSNTILKIENLSKQYRLGTIGTGTISHDLNRWWHKIRGKEDPFLKIGEVNDRATKGTSDYVWALKDINFEVKKGEVLGIIGKNGAGKSTLLKILSKVTGPTTGSIKSKGRIASLLEVGTGFHPELTGKENIFLNGAILGMTKAEINSKYDEIVEFSGCERYIDTPVKRYSSGMTVRLAFSVAAHLEPDILVVDEVLAVGDAEFQKKAIGKMQDISKGEGRTVLFVSHNMAAVKSLCTKGIVLENGGVVFEGEIDKCIDFYLLKSRSQTNLLPLERTDRIGSGKIKIKNLKFLNRNKEEVLGILSGDELNIVVEIDIFEKVNFDKLIISIAFQDSRKNTILLFSSDEMGAEFDNLKDSNNLKLRIPSLFLRGGEYNIRVVIAEGGTRKENFLDMMDNVASINILPRDIYNVGKINRSLNQAILIGYFES